MLTRLILAAFFLIQAPQATERLSEVERLRLQLVVEQQTRLSAQYDAALAQAISEFRDRPATRKILTDAESARIAANEMVERLYIEHKISKTAFKIDVASGTFVPSEAR